MTHWSRLLASRLGIDDSTFASIWQNYGVKPLKLETFKVSAADDALVVEMDRVVSAAAAFRLGEGVDCFDPCSLAASSINTTGTR